MKKPVKYSPEVRERAVRLVTECRKDHPSQWAAIESIAVKIGCSAATLHTWVRRHETDTGQRPGVTTTEAQRETFGVEPICQVLQIAPSGYRRHAAQQRNPSLRCARARRDESLIPQIERVWQVNLQVYGADKVWKQMNREGIEVARCTVERLMRRLGLRGVIRGKVVRTTISDARTACPLDQVNRQFKADRPNQLWVSDFTYVSTWQGWLYVAFVIDVFARRIVGWRVSSSMHTDFVLDALEQALYARQPERDRSLIHHSDRGSQGGFNRSSQPPTI
jgi:transposase-like protein